MKRISAFAFAALLTTTAHAVPPENADPIYKDYFKTLQNDMGGDCCSDADCRILNDKKYRQNSDGSWSAFVGKDSFGPTAPDEWLDVPDNVVIKKKNYNPTQGAVACWSRNSPHPNGFYCFHKPALGT